MGITEERAVAMEYGVVRFLNWVNSYANKWKDHPTTGEPPTPLCFDRDMELTCTSGMSFSLQTEDQNFVEFDLSSWAHLILVGLCYGP